MGDTPEVVIKAKRLPQYVAAVVATLGGFSLGTVIGWSAPAIPVIEKDHDPGPETISWIGGIFPLGGLSSMFVMAVMLDRLGRKLTMIFIMPPFIGAWCILAFGNHVIAYLVGRFLTGLCAASFCVAAPLYIGELAQKEIRGTLGVFFQLLLVIGILFSYAVGAMQNIMFLSLGCCVPIIIFLVCIVFLPESPVFLLIKERVEDAKKSLQWFRGPQYDITDELKIMEDGVRESNERKGSFKDMFSKKASVKGLLTSVLLMFCQQLSGINIVMFYAVSIFKDSGSDMDPNISSVILGFIQVVATSVAAVTVDRIGRRILLIVSHAGMGVCLIALGIYFFMKDQDEESTEKLGWLPLLSTCVYLVFFSLGSGPLPWAMLGELFANEIKGVASSFCGGVNWFLAFAVTKSFPNMLQAFGSGPTYWTYSVLCFVGTALIFLFVIETKGKTLEQIQRELGGEPEEQE